MSSREELRQEKDLFEFEDGIEAGFTTLQNAFILHHMPEAPGNYVKVYLSGLMRCFGSRTDQWASASTIAEEQNLCPKTVRRAWQHWEEKGLVQIIPRYLKDPKNQHDYKTEPDKEYCHQSSNIIRFRRNIQAPIREKSEQTNPLDTAVRPPWTPVSTKELQLEELKERQDKTLSGPVPSVDKNPVKEEELNLALIKIEENFGRPLSKSERKFLFRLLREHGSEDVDFAIGELELQKELRPIQNPLRYIKGVLKNWEREGRRLTDMFSYLERVGRLKGAAISA